MHKKLEANAQVILRFCPIVPGPHIFLIQNFHWSHLILFERGRLGTISSARAVSGIYTKPPGRRRPDLQRRAKGSHRSGIQQGICFHRRRGIAILLHCNSAPSILKFVEYLQYEIMMGSDDARPAQEPLCT